MAKDIDPGERDETQSADEAGAETTGSDTEDKGGTEDDQGGS